MKLREDILYTERTCTCSKAFDLFLYSSVKYAAVVFHKPVKEPD